MNINILLATFHQLHRHTCKEMASYERARRLEVYGEQPFVKYFDCIENYYSKYNYHKLVFYKKGSSEKCDCEVCRSVTMYGRCLTRYAHAGYEVLDGDDMAYTDIDEMLAVSKWWVKRMYIPETHIYFTEEDVYERHIVSYTSIDNCLLPPQMQNIFLESERKYQSDMLGLPYLLKAHEGEYIIKFEKDSLEPLGPNLDFKDNK